MEFPHPDLEIEQKHPRLVFVQGTWKYLRNRPFPYIVDACPVYIADHCWQFAFTRFMFPAYFLLDVYVLDFSNLFVWFLGMMFYVLLCFCCALLCFAMFLLCFCYVLLCFAVFFLGFAMLCCVFAVFVLCFAMCFVCFAMILLCFCYAFLLCVVPVLS